MLNKIIELTKSPLYEELYRYLCNIKHGLKMLEKINFPGLEECCADFERFTYDFYNIEKVEVDSKEAQRLEQLIREYQQKKVDTTEDIHELYDKHIAKFQQEMDNIIYNEKMAYLFDFAVNLQNEYAHLVLKPLKDRAFSSQLHASTFSLVHHLNVQIDTVCNVCYLLKNVLKGAYQTHLLPFGHEQPSSGFWDTCKQGITNFMFSIFQNSIKGQLGSAISKLMSTDLNAAITKMIYDPLQEYQRQLEPVLGDSKKVKSLVPKTDISMQDILFDKFPFVQFVSSSLDSVTDDRIFIDESNEKKIQMNFVNQLFFLMDNLSVILQPYKAQLDGLIGFDNLKTYWLEQQLKFPIEISVFISTLSEELSKILTMMAKSNKSDLSQLMIFLNMINQTLMQYMFSTLTDDVVKNHLSSALVKPAKGMYFHNSLQNILDIIYEWMNKVMGREVSDQAVVTCAPSFDGLALMPGNDQPQSGKQKKAPGSGMYTTIDGHKKFYLKHVNNTMYLADDVAEILCSKLAAFFGVDNCIAQCHLVKSNQNTVFVASECKAGFKPIYKSPINLTSRVLPMHRIKITESMGDHQKQQLAQILSFSLLISDRDCNVGNIGFTEHGDLNKIDHGWAFEDLTSCKIKLADELIAPRSFRATPSNAIKDFSELLYSNTFIDAIANITNIDRNIDKLKACMRENFLEIMQHYDGSGVPQQANYVSDRLEQYPCLPLKKSGMYSGRDVLNAFASRIGMQSSPLQSDEKFLDMIVDVFVTSISKRMISLICTQAILSLKECEKDTSLKKNQYKSKSFKALDILVSQLKENNLSVLDEYLPDISMSVLGKFYNRANQLNLIVPEKYSLIENWYVKNIVGGKGQDYRVDLHSITHEDDSNKLEHVVARSSEFTPSKRKALEQLTPEENTEINHGRIKNNYALR